MTSISFDVEDVSVEISHPMIELEKRKLPLGALAKFKCQGCGRRELSIETEAIKRSGTYTDSLGHDHPAIFDMVKVGQELSRERKAIEDNQDLDFIAYLQKLHLWKERERVKGEFASSGGETTISVDCPLCNTPHHFQVKISNPIEVEWGDPDLIDTFEKRGINDNNDNLDLLEKIAYRPPEYEHGEDFLTKINNVDADRKRVSNIVEEIKISIRKANFESEDAQAWVRDLASSLDDTVKVLEKELQDHLRRYLTLIQDFATSPAEVE